jgi:hypothetical protein
MIMALELCPKCQKGHLRPTGQASTDAENNELFGKTNSIRMFACDNDSCGFKKLEGELNEYVPIGETLEMKVVKGEIADNPKEDTDQ